MRFLLDTHVWLWLLVSPSRVSETARSLLLQADARRTLSVASLWEAAIKLGRGKLRLERSLSHYLGVSLAELAIDPLAVKPTHALAVAELPLHHRDPFDRMVVAQARIEGLTLVTADPALYAYDVDLLWAGPGQPPRRSDGSGRVGERPRPKIRGSARSAKPARSPGSPRAGTTATASRSRAR